MECRSKSDTILVQPVEMSRPIEPHATDMVSRQSIIAHTYRTLITRSSHLKVSLYSPYLASLHAPHPSSPSQQSMSLRHVSSLSRLQSWASPWAAHPHLRTRPRRARSAGSFHSQRVHELHLWTADLARAAHAQSMHRRPRLTAHLALPQQPPHGSQDVRSKHSRSELETGSNAFW